MKSGYLLISRRVTERIFIGDEVEILISDINGEKVDVAIKAPKHVKIHRKESIMQEQRRKRVDQVRD